MLNDIENIIKGCVAGDRNSQYKLYNLLAGKLRVVCRRYSNSKEEAEDSLQEVFIKIFANIESFRGDGEFARWARRITVNALLTKIRTEKKLVLEKIDNENEYMVASDIDVSSGMGQEFLLMIIESLPDDKKIVFNLHAIEGYEHKEISEMLGITEVHSRALLFKARKMLFSQLQKTKSGYEQIIAK